MSEIKKLEKSQVEIKDEITADVFESFRLKALKKLGENVEIDGFRKGHVPESVLEKRLGEMPVLEEAAQMAIASVYAKIIKENNIDAIGYPRINITKLAKGNPLGFTITVAVLPEIVLPDYKKIAKEAMSSKEDVAVSDEEVEAAIKNIQKMKAQEGGQKEVKDEDLPELDEEYLKKLGDFKSVDDLKIKIKENMSLEKTTRANDKKRLSMIETLAEKTKLDVPEVLISAEVEKIEHRIKHDLEHMGMKYDDYLKHLNKTEEDLRRDWQADAEKRAKIELIVGEIAKKENLSAPKEKVEEELKKVLEAYKDANPENARYYIENVLTNEEVFKFLESQK